MDKFYFRAGKTNEETIENVEKAINKWIYSAELESLVEAFGGKVPKQLETEQLARWLLEFSECWDYRGRQTQVKAEAGREKARWLIDSSAVIKQQEEVVERVIGKLGLQGESRLLCDNYDYIIALGGARMSCLFRPRYVREIIEKYDLKPKGVAMLSGMRPVMDTERSATDTYCPEAITEYDLINSGAEMVFELEKKFWEEQYYCKNPNESWAVRRYSVSKYEYPIISVSGPSSDPQHRRANSADTFRFFVQKMNIEEGSRILLVTSQIYVPYQQMEAIRTWALPNKVYIETVGFPIQWNEKNRQQGMITAANYLQEIRSTIQAINRYLGETDEYRRKNYEK